MPFGGLFLPFPFQSIHIGPDFGGNIKTFSGGDVPAFVSFLPELGSAFAVALGGAFDLGNAFADDGLGDDQLGFSVPCVAHAGKGLVGKFQVVAVDFDDFPAHGGIEFDIVAGLRLFRRGVKSDVVGIVNEDEIVQLQHGGNGHCFAGDAFLHAAVASQTENVLAENGVLLCVETGRGAFGRECEADRVGDALPQGAGGAFNSRGKTEFGVAGCL